MISLRLRGSRARARRGGGGRDFHEFKKRLKSHAEMKEDELWFIGSLVRKRKTLLACLN